MNIKPTEGPSDSTPILPLGEKGKKGIKSTKNRTFDLFKKSANKGSTPPSRPIGALEKASTTPSGVLIRHSSPQEIKQWQEAFKTWQKLPGNEGKNEHDFAEHLLFSMENIDHTLIRFAAALFLRDQSSRKLWKDEKSVTVILEPGKLGEDIAKLTLYLPIKSEIGRGSEAIVYEVPKVTEKIRTPAKIITEKTALPSVWESKEKSAVLRIENVPKGDVGNEVLQLIDQRVKEYQAAHHGELPPGVKLDSKGRVRGLPKKMVETSDGEAYGKIKEKGSMLEWIQQEDPPLEEILKAFEDPMSTFAAMMYANVLHRDLKLANMLVDGKGIGTVSDWSRIPAVDLIEEGASPQKILKIVRQQEKILDTPISYGYNLMTDKKALDETINEIYQKREALENALASGKDGKVEAEELRLVWNRQIDMIKAQMVFLMGITLLQGLTESVTDLTELVSHEQMDDGKWYISPLTPENIDDIRIAISYHFDFEKNVDRTEDVRVQEVKNKCLAFVLGTMQADMATRMTYQEAIAAFEDIRRS